MNLLITGGNGNIAKMIKQNLSNEFNIDVITRDNFDLLDYDSLKEYFKNRSYDILIHTAVVGGRRINEDSSEIVYKNLLMLENLLHFRNKFKYIFNFDSGAIYDRSTNIYNKREDELSTVPKDFYGFSKYLIYKRIMNDNCIYNFRIFNIFHVNEEQQRFIKSCFISKKNKQKVTIFNDKFFDFMYEDDFIKVIKYYIENINHTFLPKTINLSYKKKYKLSDIANMIINDPDQIIVQDNIYSFNYCGDGTLLSCLPIELDGLDVSLQKYENELKKI